jgi:energy-coupling factor transporter transmembrane protein EcfT
MVTVKLLAELKVVISVVFVIVVFRCDSGLRWCSVVAVVVVVVVVGIYIYTASHPLDGLVRFPVGM